MIRIKKPTLLGLLASLLIFSDCSKDEIEIEPEPKPDVIIDPPNQSPSLFSIDVTEIGKDYAVLTWNNSKDPDLDNVYYEVFLDNILVAAKTRDTTFTLKNLDSFKDYEGEVRATDQKSQPVKATFSFKTKTEVTVFSKLFPNLGGVDVLVSEDGGFVTAYGLNKFDSLGNVIFSSRIDPPSYGPIYTILFKPVMEGIFLQTLFKFRNSISRVTIFGLFDATVLQASDGSFIIGSKTIGAYNIYTAWVMNMSEDGDIIWNKSFSLGGDTEINSIIELDNGECMVCKLP